MASDLSGPEGPATSIERTIDTHAASAMADADRHAGQHVIDLKDIAESLRRSRQCKHTLPANQHPSYAQALGALTDATTGIAQDKNIVMSPDDCATVAGIATDSFDAATLWGIARCEQGPIFLAAATINRILDVLVGARVIYTLRAAIGCDHLTYRQVITQAEQWMRGIAIANDVQDARNHWSDPAEMVGALIEASAHVPVIIRLPEARSGRVCYCLKHGRARARRSATTAFTPLLVGWRMLIEAGRTTEEDAS